jgi:hypothetical protein
MRNGAIVAVAALVLSSLAGGCCCRTRKGIVLRGDWSLELNRVPHMQSNGPTYSGDCSAPMPCGCADGSCHGGVPSGGYEVLDGSGYPGGAGGAGGSGGHGGGGAEGGLPMPTPPQPTPAAQSRFHPVPTRPAFEPQSVTWENEPALEPVAPEAPQGSAQQRSIQSGRRGAARLAASNRSPGTSARPSPIRRTSAEVELEAAEEFGEEPIADQRQISAAALPATIAAPSQAPQPTTSTWRVKSRQS